MKEALFRGRKKIFILGGIILAIIILVSVFFIVRRELYSVTINITVAPTIANVKIGDEEFSAVGEYKIRPGEYDIEVYADGFISKTGKLTAIAGESVDFSTYLEPTEENKDWYENNLWDATILGDIKNNAEIQKYYTLRQTELILNYVPYNTYTYSINYEEKCAENGAGICLILDGEMGLRNTMVQYLQRSNEDLSRYKIKVKGYEKPLRDLELNVPDGLTYDPDRIIDVATEIADIKNSAENYVGKCLTSGEYKVVITQVKTYGEYCGIKASLYWVNGDEKIFDTYRFVMKKIQGEWTPLSNIDWVISSYDNPKLPDELLKEINFL